jgi:hypothetical protein
VSAAGHLALAVILAWLMPWRAARRIREQDQSITVLISVLALTTAGSGAPLRKVSMGGWWNRPHALAVAMAALMPWRAVGHLRSSQRALRHVSDALIAQHEKGGQPGDGAAPKARHLQLVGAPGSEATPYAGRHLKSVPRVG